jgi:hypothetical protein
MKQEWSRVLFDACFVLVSCLSYSSALNLEAISSEMSDDFHQPTRRYITEDRTLIVTAVRTSNTTQTLVGLLKNWRWNRDSSRKRSLHIHSPIRLHGVVLNLLSTGTTSPFCLLPETSWQWNLVSLIWRYPSVILGTKPNVADEWVALLA